MSSAETPRPRRTPLRGNHLGEHLGVLAAFARVTAARQARPASRAPNIARAREQLPKDLSREILPANARSPDFSRVHATDSRPCPRAAWVSAVNERRGGLCLVPPSSRPVRGDWDLRLPRASARSSVTPGHWPRPRPGPGPGSAARAWAPASRAVGPPTPRPPAPRTATGRAGGPPARDAAGTPPGPPPGPPPGHLRRAGRPHPLPPRPPASPKDDPGRGPPAPALGLPGACC